MTGIESKGSADGSAELKAGPANGRVPGRRQMVNMGRPRDPEADRRILEAALEELAVRGISHFSVSAVARRAGVAKGSVYLRWPTREQLILDASRLIIAPVRPPEAGPFRDQLAELAGSYRELFGQPRGIEMILRVDADRGQHPELFDQIFARMQGTGNRIIEDTVAAAQLRGEIDPEVRPQVVTRILTGAMFVEALAHNPAGEVSSEFCDDLVAFLADRLERRTAS